MLGKALFLIVIFLLFLFNFYHQAYAVYDPRTVENNKIGIHILFPDEIAEAEKLVNSSGGDWGYVTIPIQSGDKDLIKWQNFMDQAKRLHLIPILRIATEGDYFNTKVWRKPKEEDVLDFANFLDSLNWPIKNRYVIFFNEVNRSDEWDGDTPNPGEYAKLLNYAVTIFKSKNPDFFIISAGLDNAAINTSRSINQYDFLLGMNKAVPGIFQQIDGLGSHSYPNPGFSQPPTLNTRMGTSSFIYESSLLESLINKKLPVFITETGWSQERVTADQEAEYLKEAFAASWNDINIVAVTPFLLRANSGSFINFSYLKNDLPTEEYNALKEISKKKGAPRITETVLGTQTLLRPLEEKNFNLERTSRSFLNREGFKIMIKWLLKLDDPL